MSARDDLKGRHGDSEDAKQPRSQQCEASQDTDGHHARHASRAQSIDDRFSSRHGEESRNRSDRVDDDEE